MAVTQQALEHVLEQIGGAGSVRAKRMFGEVGLYCDEIFCALICDDVFYVKDTPAGRDFAPDLPLAPPYPNAKPHLQIDGDRLEDPDWAAELVRITAAALPKKAPRKPKKS